MSLPFLRPMDIDPLGPSDWARWAFVFILFSYPLTPFGSSLSAEGGQLGWQSNRHMLTVRCSWVDGRNIGVNGDRLNWDDSWNAKQTVTRFMGWWFRKNEVVSVQSSDKLPRSIYGARHMLSLGWFISRIEASLRLPCTSPIKSTTLPLIFLLFAKNTLSERVRHLCQRSIHSTPASFNLIRSYFPW